MMKMTWIVLFALAVAVIATPQMLASPVHSVPEIDPSMGVGALALLGGAIMVMRGRAAKR